MATYFVGPGGSDAANGLSWANRKLTLNGAEDIPVAAGDTVYVGPGTYRELLQLDVSGSSGNPITYIADLTGANTNGVGGEVRITGSDNDQTATRANCIVATAARDYRTFRGFALDTTTQPMISLTNCSNCIFEDLTLRPSAAAANIIFVTGTGTNNTFRRIWDYGPAPSGGSGTTSWLFTHSSTVDNAGHVVQNCVFMGRNSSAIRSDRVGGITVRNCWFNGCVLAVRVGTALTAGQLMTVNNCIITGCVVGVQATTTAEFAENHNNFFLNGTDRTNVTAGANSTALPPYITPLLLFGDGTIQRVIPFTLSSYSALRDRAGTSPPSVDIFGAARPQGSDSDWGPVEAYTLTPPAGGGGGGIFRSGIFGGGSG